MIRQSEYIKIPQIRFKGFTDAWEQCEFKEIFNYERPDEYIVSSEEYSDTYSIPVLTANKGFILGYTNETRIFEKPCVIFDDFTLDSKYVDFPFMVKSSAMKILTTKEGFDLRFSYELLNSTKIENLGHARHYISVVQPTLVKAPKHPEQAKISVLFKRIDSLITLHQRKHDKIVNIKKSLLDKMFPKEGQIVPELRFKGFTDAWEQCKFGKVADTKRGLTYKPTDVVNNGIRVLRSSNIYEDYFEQREDDVFVTQNAINIDYVKSGDILITSANGSSRLVGKHAIIDNIVDNATVHGGFMLLARTKYPHFLNASMSSKWYEKFINLHVAGGNGAIGNLSKTNLDEYDIQVPSDSEKFKIGELFRSVDSLITLHQRKLDKLKNVKKSLLDKMFV